MTASPTSPAQFAASDSGTPPVPEAVRDGIWAFAIPLPVSAPPYTLCYAIEDEGGDLHLVDPGWAGEQSEHVLSGALAQFGSSIDRVASVTVTHLHPDHLGMAEQLRAASGASVVMHETEQRSLDALVLHGEAVPDLAGWGVPADRIDELAAIVNYRHHDRVHADRVVIDGDRLDIPGRDVRVIHTPGHTSGHISLRAVHEKVIFTGDHVLPKIFPGVGLGGDADNPLGDYLESLARVVQFDDHEVCPGHGYRFHGLGDRCAETRDHQLTRTAQVEELLLANPTGSVWEIASGVSWTDGWAGLRSFHIISALAQTAMRMRYLRE